MCSRTTHTNQRLSFILNVYTLSFWKRIHITINYMILRGIQCKRNDGTLNDFCYFTSHYLWFYYWNVKMWTIHFILTRENSYQSDVYSCCCHGWFLFNIVSKMKQKQSTRKLVSRHLYHNSTARFWLFRLKHVEFLDFIEV